jgi:hypothetical protein
MTLAEVSDVGMRAVAVRNRVILASAPTCSVLLIVTPLIVLTALVVALAGRWRRGSWVYFVGQFVAFQTTGFATT